MNKRPSIITYDKKYQQQVIDLIVGIQSGEFGVSITASDQPDLSNIDTYYQKGNGQFWLALDDSDHSDDSQGQVLGTVALSDIGNNQVGLRKMFVKEGFRGKPLNIGQSLMDAAIQWCQQKDIKDIYLGTVPSYHAAHRFYEKNNFIKIPPSQLPKSFDIMAVDKYFYHLPLTPLNKK